MLPTFSEIFATLLNAVVKNHPSDIDIVSLEGRSFCVAIDELPQDIAIKIESGKVSAHRDDELADVTVSGSLKAVIDMIQNENDGLENDELYISGKIGTAKQFQQFLSSLAINWKLFFGQFMSENSAIKTADSVEQGFHVLRGGIEQIGAHFNEYLIREDGIVVPQSEFETFSEHVKELNARLDVLLDKVNGK